MKRIKFFEKKTLLRFTIFIKFESDLTDLSITQAANIERNLKDLYPLGGNLLLLPSRGNVNIGMGPLSFHSKDKKNNIQLGRDFIVFEFNEYSLWVQELEKIKSTLMKINEVKSLPNIKEMIFTYIDDFNIPCKDFDFTKYFTLSLNTPVNWDIQYNDLTLGLVVHKDDYEKVIFRFRALGIKDEKYKFRIESVFSNYNISLPITDESRIKEAMDNAHTKIESFFIELLTENYRSDLKLEIEEI